MLWRRAHSPVPPKIRARVVGQRRRGGLAGGDCVVAAVGGCFAGFAVVPPPHFPSVGRDYSLVASTSP